MNYLFSFLVILSFITTVISTFYIQTTENLDCESSHVACLSNTTFTTCTNPDSYTVLTNVVLECPDGYVCDTSTNKPCVLPGSITSATTNSSTESTTSVSTTEGTTETTTRYTVARPTDKPHCTSENVGVTYVGVECNQYYICVKHSAIISWYTATSYTCDDGYVFSSTQMACVTEDQSDCP